MTDRILVVEDEMYMAMVLKDLLSEAGYQVFTAADMGTALDLIARESFDGAIVDVNLGGEHAYPVAETLRTRGIPFAFASAYTADAISREFGPCRVLAKPYTCEDLLSTVEDVLGHSH